MTADQKEELTLRLAEIREQLDAITRGVEPDEASLRRHNKRLYAEMVALERRLFENPRRA